ncbi:MAG: hypothetical protein EOP84_29765, partial [Verrucomicrobiaceae bacterium]
MNLDTPLNLLDGIPPQRVRQLERFGLSTVSDLLHHFPKRWEDRNQFDRFPAGESEEPVCVCGIVRKTSVRRLKGWQKMFDVFLEEENAHALSGHLVCRWFNQHWVEKVVATGQRLVVYGKPKRRGKEIILDHPEFEVMEEDAESIHLRRIVPIHRATEGLTTRVLRQIVWKVLQEVREKDVPQFLPTRLDSFPRYEALKQIHFPESAEMLARARRHLILEEFFAMQLFIAAKHTEQEARPG